MATLVDVPKGMTPNTYRRVVAAASAAYTVKRGIPSVEEVVKYYDGATVNTPRIVTKALASPEFKSLMRARGYNFDAGAALSPEQFFAVSIITNPSDRRPLNAKLRAAGITYAQYRAWLKQPLFREYIAKVSEDMLGEHVADVHTRVVERATNGDVQAIKLYYELTGRHDPARQQMADVQAIIKLLLEIIMRYVTDVDVLARIHADVDRLLSGKPIDAISAFDVTRIANHTANVVESQVVARPADFNVDAFLKQLD